MLTEEIYTQAMQFLKGAERLRRQMEMRELLSTPLELPLSGGQTGYLAIDPAGAVLLLVGEDALQGYLRLITRIRKEEEDDQAALQKLRIGTDNYALSFTGSQTLTPQEYSFCQKYKRRDRKGGHKHHGHRGKKNTGDPHAALYPLLRRWEPHRLGQEVTDPQALEWVQEALRAANWVIDHFGSDSLPAPSALLDAQELLQLIPQKDGYATELFPRPEVWPALFPLQPLPQEMDQMMADLKALPHEETWELSLLDLLPPDCTTPDGDPLPASAHDTGMNTCLVCVRSGTDRGLPGRKSMVQDFADCPWHLLQVVTQLFLERQTCPKEVLVDDDETGMLLRQWCRRAGIRLRRVQELESLSLFDGPEPFPADEEEEENFAEEEDRNPDWDNWDEDTPLYARTEEDRREAARIEEKLERMTIQEIEAMPESERGALEIMAFLGLLTDRTVEKLHSAGGKLPDIPDSLTDPWVDPDWPIRELPYELPRADGRPTSRITTTQDGGESTLILGSYEGSFVFSVSAGSGCWRHLQVSADLTLAELSDAILDAFDIKDRSQSHVFYLQGRIGSGQAICARPEDYTDEYDPEATTTRDIKLGAIRFLKRDQKLAYIYDFDADWRFHCRVLRVLSENTDGAKVLRSKGVHPAAR